LAWFPSVRIKSHPKQDFNGSFDEANCLGCHQGKAAHGETEPINAQSCYRCHLTPDGRGELFGRFHCEADWGEQPVTYAAALAYQFSLAVFCWSVLRFILRRFRNRPKPES
jgi:hypothetical protein